ncbi:Uncharacterized protein HZ326_12089 [Fusarium oxysporum f. sp. albedinis]|nr:Uncharacterized protein HZ326_12089 [Fusarium oxysporum f. sp. albedinis]
MVYNQGPGTHPLIRPGEFALWGVNSGCSWYPSAIATDASRAAPGAVTAKEASSPIHEVPVRFISRAAPTETEADADEATAWPTITQSRA